MFIKVSILTSLPTKKNITQISKGNRMKNKSIFGTKKNEELYAKNGYPYISHQLKDHEVVDDGLLECLSVSLEYHEVEYTKIAHLLTSPKCRRVDSEYYIYKIDDRAHLHISFSSAMNKYKSELTAWIVTEFNLKGEPFEEIDFRRLHLQVMRDYPNSFNLKNEIKYFLKKYLSINISNKFLLLQNDSMTE
jgi:hypothetical protein